MSPQTPCWRDATLLRCSRGLACQGTGGGGRALAGLGWAQVGKPGAVSGTHGASPPVMLSKVPQAGAAPLATTGLFNGFCCAA